MAKFSGFILSTILVVFCLWLSVFSFPNAVRDGDVFQTTDSSSRAVVSDCVKTLDSSEASVPLDAASDEGPIEARTNDASFETTAVNVSSSSLEETALETTRADAVDMELTEASLEREVVSSQTSASEDKDALKAHDRTRNGKYVSIPSVQIDPFQTRNGSSYADRVINVKRVEIPNIDAVL